MNRPLAFQLTILVLVALLLAFLNNLRPHAAIQWVRDWPEYSQIAAEKETPEKKETTPAAEDQARPEEKGETDSTESIRKTMDFVVQNNGVTDIDLETASRIHRYAKDFTFWIDARSPDLFEEGHIQGAHLLYLYEKQDYLPGVEAEIQAAQPIALVVYCKGKDCTDSHHLAQDLHALGYENIFVYRDGFDEWYEAGFPIEGRLAESSETADEGDPRAIADMIAANTGITDVDLQKARDIHRYAKDYTFWIDARSPDLFEEGHIQGAHLLYLYEKNDYLPEVEAQIQEQQPVALVVYCKGKECTDSHHLAQDLNAMGYNNIFVYRDGFDDWYQAGYPIEGRLAQGSPASETPTPRAPLEKKPPGMYLEHIVRDAIPFLFGLFLLLFWKKTSVSRPWIWTASIVLGLFFIYASIPKIDNPFLFAKDIWNYDIAPGPIINLSALLLPMMELTAGICLVSGLFRRGAGLIVCGLLITFILAVSYNVLRGHEFNCGCTADTTMFTDIYFAGWNDKVTLLLRDSGLFVMSLIAFLSRAK